MKTTKTVTFSRLTEINVPLTEILTNKKMCLSTTMNTADMNAIKN